MCVCLCVYSIVHDLSVQILSTFAPVLPLTRCQQRTMQYRCGEQLLKLGKIRSCDGNSQTSQRALNCCWRSALHFRILMPPWTCITTALKPIGEVHSLWHTKDSDLPSLWMSFQLRAKYVISEIIWLGVGLISGSTPLRYLAGFEHCTYHKLFCWTTIILPCFQKWTGLPTN